MVTHTPTPPPPREWVCWWSYSFPLPVYSRLQWAERRVSSLTLSTTTFRPSWVSGGSWLKATRKKQNQRWLLRIRKNCFKSLQSDFQSTVSLLSFVSWHGFRRSEALSYQEATTETLLFNMQDQKNSSTSQPKTWLTGNLDILFFFWQALLNPPGQLPGLSLVFKVA